MNRSQVAPKPPKWAAKEPKAFRPLAHPLRLTWEFLRMGRHVARTNQKRPCAVHPGFTATATLTSWTFQSWFCLPILAYIGIYIITYSRNISRLGRIFPPGSHSCFWRCHGHPEKTSPSPPKASCGQKKGDQKKPRKNTWQSCNDPWPTGKQKKPSRFGVPPGWEGLDADARTLRTPNSPGPGLEVLRAAVLHQTGEHDAALRRFGDAGDSAMRTGGAQVSGPKSRRHLRSPAKKVS